MPPGWSDAYLDRLERGKSPKTTVSVLYSGKNKGLPPELDLKLKDMLMTSLVQTGKMHVVEESERAQVKEQQMRAFEEVYAAGFAGTQRFDPDTAPRIRKLLFTQAIVFVSVTSATQETIDKFAYHLQRFQVVLNARAVDMTTGSAFLSEAATGTSEAKLFKTAGGQIIAGAEHLPSGFVNAAKEAVDSVAAKVSAHYPLLGYVVRVRDDNIYLDVGEARGGKQGDVFIVFRRGSEVLQPRSGAHLGWEKTILGSVKITSSEKDMSVARLLKLKNPQMRLEPGDLAVSVSKGGS